MAAVNPLGNGLLVLKVALPGGATGRMTGAGVAAGLLSVVVVVLLLFVSCATTGPSPRRTGRSASPRLGARAHDE